MIVLPATLLPPGSGNNDTPLSETENWDWIPEGGSVILQRRCNCNTSRGPFLSPETGFNARLVSNAYFDGSNAPKNDRLTGLAWAMGQFLDHDMVLVAKNDNKPKLQVSVTDPEDPFRKAGITKLEVSHTQTTLDAEQCKVEVSSTTPLVDGSHIYGNTKELALSLRSFDGDGTLKSQLLGAGGKLEEYMLFDEHQKGWHAGDERSAETVPLSVMHTLFHRNHNYWAREVRKRNPYWSGDQVFYKARQLSVVELQRVTWEEWLPAILGHAVELPAADSQPTEGGPVLFQEFTAAGFRFGHSLVSERVGTTELRDIFFQPQRLVDRGMPAWLTDLHATPSNAIDLHVVDALRNFLFGDMGMDLVVLNLVRGRALNLPSFETYQACVNPPPVNEPITGTTDLFKGLLDHPPTMVGIPPLLAELIETQFNILAEADPHFYTRLTVEPEYQVTGSLSELIIRLTGGRLVGQSNLFLR